MRQDGCAYGELVMLLRENRDSQDDLEQRLKLIESGEEKISRIIQEGIIAVERLSIGWTGEDAEKYITETLEDDELFRKQFDQVFSQEKNMLLDKLRRLQREERDISDELLKIGRKEYGEDCVKA